MRGQILHAEVKFVVAQCAGVVAHAVHQAYFDLALVEREERRALREVAAVEEKEFGVLGPLGFKEGYATQEATAVGLHCIFNEGTNGEDGAMCVVGVQDDEALVAIGKGSGTEDHPCEQN